MDFFVPTNRRVKLKECKKRDKYLDFAWEQKKTVGHGSDDYTNCSWCSWYSHQMIGIRAEVLGSNRTGRDSPNYSIVEIGQNTEKGPGDLKRLAVTQIPVENHQLTLMWKTLTEIIIIIIIPPSVRQWSGKSGFNPRSCYTKEFKMVLDTSLLNTQQYKVCIIKWRNPGKRVAPSPTPWVTNYWKREPFGYPQLQ